MKNRILLIVLMLLLIMPSNIKVLAKETDNKEPVGEPWVTANGSYRINILAAQLSEPNKEYLVISDGSYSGYYIKYKYFATIPLRSKGGTYTIETKQDDPTGKHNPGRYSDFKKIFKEEEARRGRVNTFSVGHTFYKDTIYYANPFSIYSRSSVDEFYNDRIPAFDHHMTSSDDWVNIYSLYLGFLEEHRNSGVGQIYYDYEESIRKTGISSYRLVGDYAIGIVNDKNGYYLSKIGGREPEALYRTRSSWLRYATARDDSNHIFFVDEEEKKVLFLRTNFDGTSRAETLQTYPSNISIMPIREVPKHNYIIYKKKDEDAYEDYSIYRANIDGSREVLLIDSNASIKLITDNYIYYSKDGKTFRQHIVNTGVNEQLFNFTVRELYTMDDDTFFYTHSSRDYWNTIYKYSLNDPPELILNTPLNSTESKNYYVKEEGLSTINVSGSVRDINNNKVTVTAELGGVTKSKEISNTSSSKQFNFTFDIFKDNISDGKHTLTVVATDEKGAKSPERTRTIIVKGRVKHDDYVLVGSPLYYQLLYEDIEKDAKYQEQFRYSHSPNYFKNSLGIINDSNTWKNGVYNSLDKTGHYKITYRAKDNPKNVTAFNEFRKWSRESLSEINLYVHRKPIAVFKATINSAGKVTVTDFNKSYDLDHQGETNNGIIAKQWRWRNINSPTWTNSSNPPTYLSPGEDYIIALRVRDKDGSNGIGVWSDWTEISISTGALAPLKAMFTLNPSSVSHSKTITTTNLSTGTITRYEWIIKNSSGRKVGSTISTLVPTSAQLKAGGIGKYTLQLRVGDDKRWSEPYTLPYEVINNPPVASFNSPDIVYRDTNILLTNTTPPDLDGDTIKYQWKLRQPNGTEYNISTAKNPSFKIQSFISSKGIKPIDAISKDWEIKLIVTDAKGAKSEYTRELEVINNPPMANISGNAYIKQFTTHKYTSNDTDKDIGDNPLKIFRWKHIKPDGSFKNYTTKDTNLIFNEYGKHIIEHWAIDRIGDKSNIATLDINVIKNLPPKMTITNPNGTKTNPKILQGDPLMKWKYTDIENDIQEKYSFDFYSEDDTLIDSIEKIGDTKQYQMPNGTFERFKTIKAIGKTYSKYNWSKPSNEVFFIINDAPIGGFNLNKSPAEYLRGEEIKITGFGDDPNIVNGDSISFKYYLRKSGVSTWTPIASEKDFTYIINTLTSGRAKDTYEIKQIITDSLGFTAPETIKIFTINNRKPKVNTIEPSSKDIDNPTQMIDLDLKPIIKWDYTDEDGDSQKQFKVDIFKGNTLVQTSKSVNSQSTQWKVNNTLEESTIYSVEVSVYDGHEWSKSEKRYFKVISLKITGYLLPNPALAGDNIYFFITTEGYADKLEIVVPNDLITMDKRVEMGYEGVDYPSIFFDVDGSIKDKEDKLKYQVWVSTEDTINKHKTRIRPPYKFIVRAYKGSITREIELELDIRGSVLELLKPGIKNKYGK